MLVNDKDVTQAKYLHLISFSPAVNSVFDLGVNLKKLSTFIFRITWTQSPKSNLDERFAWRYI